MKTKKHLILFVVLLVMHFSDCLAQSSYDWSILRSRMRSLTEAEFRAESLIPKAATWVSSQQSNGSWSGLNYGISTNNSRDETEHLKRVCTIAIQVSKSGGAQYNNTSYKDAVKKGLEYWRSSNTVAVNFWFREIGYPRWLAAAMI